MVNKYFNFKQDIHIFCYFFRVWLLAGPGRAKCKFIMARGVNKMNSYKRSEYICGRSGSYTSSADGKGQLKDQGSKKVGHHCTAQIIVKDYSNTIHMQYFKQHYKHDFQMCHLPLPQETKNIVAGK